MRQTHDSIKVRTALRAVAAIAKVGGWEVDFASGMTSFSPELCHLLGAPELAPLSIEEANNFWFEEDRAPFNKRLENVREYGTSLVFEGRSVDPDGALRYWRLLGEPVLLDGRCVALNGAAQDITEWRHGLLREQAALKAAEQMSGFLATMSHEIRTPLNGVLGMAQAMGRGPLSLEQRERLDVIESSGEILLSLLNDLLDLSKIEDGKVELETGVIDTRALADDTRDIFSALVRDKHLRLELFLAPDARGYWAGDPKRVRQILHNLISNAVKFTDRGSITVDIAHAGERLTFRVQDTGIGIAAGQLDHVFDRFVQVDASATRRYGGSGLGLAICRDLVTLMGGAITVESTEGLGTVFTVSLPLPRADAPAPPAAAPTDPASFDAGLRVLAAEDNATNQRVLKALLGIVGVEPHFVENGQAALDAWSAAPWDIVLMDVQMPVMDGPTAVRLMREIERREGRVRTPIIALTANAMTHHEALYREAGMDALVPKPINLARLLQAMDEVMPPAAPGPVLTTLAG